MTSVPSPAPPAPAASPAAPADIERPHEGGYRDTVESILIAFILAFIFRAFVVEAFVIPTGSMAPTLLGAHARFICNDCGYKFESNYSSGAGDDNIPAEVPYGSYPPEQSHMRDPDRERQIDCPNCGYTVHDPTDETRRPRTNIPIHYGDRILVLKYAYLGQEPRRWDVVVFKSPDEPGPGAGWYTTNFIKRLVGNPNEKLMILDGDVYVSTSGLNPADFKLQSKPRHVQEALWRIVCDNEFLPRYERPADERWQPWMIESGSGWDIGSAERPQRVLRFNAPQGSSGTIRFDNTFNKGRAFTDLLAYAQIESGRNNVSDARLSFLYQRKSGDGPLRLTLTKQDETFTAELSRGAARLFRKRGKFADGDLGQEIASAPRVAALGSGPIQVEFMNVDHVVTLRVGNDDVLQASYESDVAALMKTYATRPGMPKPEVLITAAGQACSLSHVSLWRDVYYTVESNHWAHPDKPIELGDDEYFVLGDNTVISKDARYWTEPVNLDAEDLHVQAGRVPGRFLLGKAFFVYWPAGYRPFGSSSLPGFIPNFGDMRAIH